MEIRLAKIHSNTIEFKDLLSIDQFNEFEKSISQIEELHNVRRLLDFVLINNDEFIEFLGSSFEELLEKSVSWNGMKMQDGNKIFLNANRLLLNYLSSIKTFIDHLETFLKRKYGSESPIFLEFKKILSHFYDNSFSYRFFYKLRNYAQHVGLPLQSFKYSSEYDRANHEIRGRLHVIFQKQQLLADYDWGKQVRTDLEKMKEEFDVTPLLLEMTHNVKEIEQSVELLHRNELLEAAEYITNLTRHLHDKECEICVAHNFVEKENGEIAKFEQIFIPFDTIDFIRNSLASEE